MPAARQTHFFSRNQPKYLGNAAWREIRAINGGEGGREERSIVGESTIGQTRRENKGGEGIAIYRRHYWPRQVSVIDREFDGCSGEGEGEITGAVILSPSLSVSRCNNFRCPWVFKIAR